MNLDVILEKIYDYLAQYGLKLLAAIVIFLVGRWLAGVVGRVVEKAMVKAHIDKTVAKFTKNLTHIGILVVVVIAALGTAGVETAQFAVVLGAAGLAIGLALQGSLANFAAGFLMIIFRPFKVGGLHRGGGSERDRPGDSNIQYDYQYSGQRPRHNP